MVAYTEARGNKAIEAGRSLIPLLALGTRGSCKKELRQEVPLLKNEPGWKEREFLLEDEEREKMDDSKENRFGQGPEDTGCLRRVGLGSSADALAGKLQSTKKDFEPGNDEKGSSISG